MRSGTALFGKQGRSLPLTGVSSKHLPKTHEGAHDLDAPCSS